jgi:hypothetical protein
MATHRIPTSIINKKIMDKSEFVSGGTYLEIKKDYDPNGPILPFIAGAHEPRFVKVVRLSKIHGIIGERYKITDLENTIIGGLFPQDPLSTFDYYEIHLPSDSLSIVNRYLVGGQRKTRRYRKTKKHLKSYRRHKPVKNKRNTKRTQTYYVLLLQN